MLADKILSSLKFNLITPLELFTRTKGGNNITLVVTATGSTATATGGTSTSTGRFSENVVVMNKEISPYH